jgi:hypothetical protein
MGMLGTHRAVLARMQYLPDDHDLPKKRSYLARLPKDLRLLLQAFRYGFRVVKMDGRRILDVGFTVEMRLSKQATRSLDRSLNWMFGGRLDPLDEAFLPRGKNDPELVITVALRDKHPRCHYTMGDSQVTFIDEVHGAVVVPRSHAIEDALAWMIDGWLTKEAGSCSVI